jgi:FkbM family methyltransferase
MKTAMTAARRLVQSYPLLRRIALPAVHAIRRINPSSDVTLARSRDRLFKAVEEGSLVVSLPDFLGSFEFDCHSHLLRRIMIHGGYEPEVVDEVKARIDPGRDAIDIGANVGLFTVLMSGLLAAPRRVLAIEPTPGALQYLRRNLVRNHRTDQTIVFAGVATRAAGQFSINVVPSMEEFSSILELVHPTAKCEPMERMPVAGDTVDNLVERFALHPGFIKVDTEGAELDVLLGARQTVAKYNPVIVCESWPDELVISAGGSPGAVTRLLRSYGYDVQDRDGQITAVPAPTVAWNKRPPKG